MAYFTFEQTQERYTEDPTPVDLQVKNHYMPPANEMRGELTPGLWLLAEYKRRKALGFFDVKDDAQ